MHEFPQMEKYLQNLPNNGLPRDLFACKDQHVAIVHLKLNWAGNLLFSFAAQLQELPAGIQPHLCTESPTL